MPIIQEIAEFNTATTLEEKQQIIVGAFKSKTEDECFELLQHIKSTFKDEAEFIQLLNSSFAWRSLLEYAVMYDQTSITRYILNVFTANNIKINEKSLLANVSCRLYGLQYFFGEQQIKARNAFLELQKQLEASISGSSSIMTTPYRVGDAAVEALPLQNQSAQTDDEDCLAELDEIEAAQLARIAQRKADREYDATSSSSSAQGKADEADPLDIPPPPPQLLRAVYGRLLRQHAAAKLAPGSADDANISVYAPEYYIDEMRALVREFDGCKVILKGATGDVEVGVISPGNDLAVNVRLLLAAAKQDPVNTSGDIGVNEYSQPMIAFSAPKGQGQANMEDVGFNGLSQDAQSLILRLKFLMRNFREAGIAHASKFGGYGGTRNPVTQHTSPIPVLLVNHPGLQFQQTYNDGPALCFPDSPNFAQPFYVTQRQSLTGKQDGFVEIRLTDGKRYLPEVHIAQVAEDFYGTILTMLSHPAAANGQKLDIRYLREGGGFFAEALNGTSLLDDALANGVIRGLERLSQLKDSGKDLKIQGHRFAFPFYNLTSSQRAAITQLCAKLGIEFAGATPIDALAPPKESYLLAINNCGDPHTAPGNEGSYGSVDAAISTNLGGIANFNVWLNQKMPVNIISSVPPVQQQQAQATASSSSSVVQRPLPGINAAAAPSSSSSAVATAALGSIENLLFRESALSYRFNELMKTKYQSAYATQGLSIVVLAGHNKATFEHNGLNAINLCNASGNFGLSVGLIKRGDDEILAINNFIKAGMEGHEGIAFNKTTNSIWFNGRELITKEGTLAQGATPETLKAAEDYLTVAAEFITQAVAAKKLNKTAVALGDAPQAAASSSSSAAQRDLPGANATADAMAIAVKKADAAKVYREEKVTASVKAMYAAGDTSLSSDAKVEAVKIAEAAKKEASSAVTDEAEAVEAAKLAVIAATKAAALAPSCSSPSSSSVVQSSLPSINTAAAAPIAAAASGPRRQLNRAYGRFFCGNSDDKADSPFFGGPLPK